MTKHLFLLCCLFSCFFGTGVFSAHAQTITVGKDKQYATVKEAAAAAQDGDTIKIDGGVYKNDYVRWTAKNLTIQGSRKEGIPHMKSTGNIPNGKAIWVIAGTGYTISDIEFSGAKVADRNGAGIRLEAFDITIKNSRFHNNENGILSGAGTGYVTILNSRFSHNGAGDGYTHNIYIGEIDKFTLQQSVSRYAKVGHNVKSRAKENYILYNNIQDEIEGTASYQIDIPNGGKTHIIGNTLHQGKEAQNTHILEYGKEGLKHPSRELVIIHNTFVNDMAGGIPFLFADGVAPTVENNLFVDLQYPDGHGNIVTKDPKFKNRITYDFHLTADSPAVNGGGSVNFVPAFHPEHADIAPRVQNGQPDSGAYEFGETATNEAGNQEQEEEQGSTNTEKTTEKTTNEEAGNQTPKICHLFTSPDTLPKWIATSQFSPPYNIFTPAKELLVKALCQTEEITLSVGSANDADGNIVLKYGYVLEYPFINGSPDATKALWKKFSFDVGGDPLGTSFLKKWAQKKWTTVNMPIDSKVLRHGTYIATYICTLQNNTYQCGCTAVNVCSPKDTWNIQKIQYTTPVQ